MYWFLMLGILAALAALFLLPQLKGFRTQIFGSVVAVVGGVVPLAADLLGYLQAQDLAQIMPPKYAPLVMLVIGLIVIVLRWMTTGPVGTKE